MGEGLGQRVQRQAWRQTDQRDALNSDTLTLPYGSRNVLRTGVRYGRGRTTVKSLCANEWRLAPRCSLAAFSAVLRSEVDLDTLSRELIEVVHSSVQPTDAWLWLRPAPGSPPHEGRSVSQPASTHAAFPQKANGSTGYRQ